MKTGLDDYILKLPNRYIRLPAAVKAALEKAETQRRVALLEIRLQGLLDQLKVGVFRANRTGELLECNRAFLNLLSVDSLTSVQTMQLLNLQELYSQLINQPLRQQECELQLNRADGMQIWVLLSTTLNQINGETVIDGLIEDITARKQVEAQLRQLTLTLEERVKERTQELEAANRELTALNRQLALANQDLEEFACSVSHDFRAPLRAIQGFSEILLERQTELSNPNYQIYLQRIFENARQLDRLTQELLTYCQLSRIDMPLQPINLSLLMAQILARQEAELQQQKAIVQVEEPLAEVIGNRIILEQVLINLLTNAIKFVAPGVQPQVRVWVEERKSEEACLTQTNSPPHSDWIRLWVQDNGIGIADSDLERIFSVFERLHGSEVYPGTGIGLAIVRKGVERMGGRVGVESQLGRGSRFWIELPKATKGE